MSQHASVLARDGMSRGIDREQDPRLLCSQVFLRKLVLLGSCSWQLSSLLTSSLVVFSADKFSGCLQR